MKAWIISTYQYNRCHGDYNLTSFNSSSAPNSTCSLQTHTSIHGIVTQYTNHCHNSSVIESTIIVYGTWLDPSGHTKQSLFRNIAVVQVT